jgi:hypothetical protein
VRAALLAGAVAAALMTGSVSAQTRRAPAPKAAPAPTPPPLPAPRIEPAMLNCPSILGDGTQTSRTYCDVQIGRDPAAGILVTLPPHAGTLALMFDLHNRHTYSEELVKARKAYTRYTATIGVLTMNNDLITRAVVFNEFRTAADLFDRISGGSGPGGLKAVAPTGIEPIKVTIPESEATVSILGEKLTVVRPDATDNFTTSGRPIALISNVRIEYTPPPPPKPAAKPAPARRRR